MAQRFYQLARRNVWRDPSHGRAISFFISMLFLLLFYYIFIQLKHHKYQSRVSRMVHSAHTRHRKKYIYILALK